MESFRICLVCCLSYVEILLSMRNRLLLKVSKFKIKSDVFCYFHVSDTWKFVDLAYGTPRGGWIGVT